MCVWVGLSWLPFFSPVLSLLPPSRAERATTQQLRGGQPHNTNACDFCAECCGVHAVRACVRVCACPCVRVRVRVRVHTTAQVALSLGRHFGIVVKNSSLAVLSTLEQHLEHRIRPAASRVALRAAYDAKQNNMVQVRVC